MTHINFARGLERPVASLRPYDRNARTHTKRQIDQIARSIQRFGFTNPVLIDGADNIIAGHGRVMAAKQLGIETVPVVRIDGMSKAERKAYIIADNRLAELAGWDEEILAAELSGILEIEPDFDLDMIGFDEGALAALINGKDVVDSVVEEPDADAPVVSQRGDLWVLGKHRIICGDARNTADYARLMHGEKAQMVFTDPPYNVRVDGHVCGLGKVKHEEFAMASGEMSEAEFTSFLAEVTRNLVDFSADGSIHYICMDWRHTRELIEASRGHYAEWKNLCVWNKDNGGMGTFYRSKHELVFVFKNGTAPHINNFGLGENGRYRTNVWDYAGVNSLKAERAEELAMHPTVKPVALVADAIRDCSKRSGIVLDAFSGSGTTIVAAEQTGRRAYAIEYDPRYVDTAVRRWEKLTGKEAVLEGSSMAFADMEMMVA